MEIVDRPWHSNVERHAAILDAIMSTAFYNGKPKAVRFGPGALPWSIGGLRNILARRGFRLRTKEQYDYHSNGTRVSRDLWVEPITPPAVEKTKRFAGARRIRLVERKS